MNQSRSRQKQYSNYNRTHTLSHSLDNVSIEEEPHSNYWSKQAITSKLVVVKQNVIRALLKEYNKSYHPTMLTSPNYLFHLINQG